MKKLATVLVLGLCWCGAGAVAQSKPKTPIAFTCQCGDAVASEFATSFRDLLASSPRYREASEAVEKAGPDGKGAHYWIHLQAVSVDPDSTNAGRRTAISEVLLIGDDYYLTQEVQTCPAHEVGDCAKRSLSWIDDYLNRSR